MSSSKDKKKKPHGQIRQSQVVMTFGPGSMFDLPNQAVIIGGLEYWTKGDEVHKPRLLAKLKDLLQLSSLVLHAPPPPDHLIVRDALGLQVLMHDHGLDAVAQAGFRPDLGRLRADDLGVQLRVEHAAVHEQPSPGAVAAPDGFVGQENPPDTTPR